MLSMLRPQRFLFSTCSRAAGCIRRSRLWQRRSTPHARHAREVLQSRRERQVTVEQRLVPHEPGALAEWVVRETGVPALRPGAVAARA
eukprot:7909139-Alexandrium_andersonii.AAC.1